MKTKFEFLFLLVNIQVLFTATIIYCTEPTISTIPTNSNEFTTVPRTDAELAAYQQFIVNLAKDYWNNYFQYLDYFVSRDDQYAIIEMISSMSTLHIMGLKEEFEQARQWVVKKFDQFTYSHSGTAVFITSRLLACYALSNDKLFLQMATEMIEKFEILKNIDQINKTTEENEAAIFAHVALPFRYLTSITGDVRYENYTTQLMKDLQDILECKIHCSPEWIENETSKLSLHRGANLFYIKAAYYLMKADTHGQTYADQLFTNIEKTLSNNTHGWFWNLKTSNGSAKLRYLQHDKGLHMPDNLMLTKDCQFGTTFSLAAQIVLKKYSNETTFQLTQRMLKFWELAKSIEKTCYTVANRTLTKLPADIFDVEEVPPSSVRHTQMTSLSSEIPQMYFVFWQLTGDEIYREKAWQFMQSIYKYGYDAKEKIFNRFCTDGSPHSDQFRSYRTNPLSVGTLSYLYLIFSDKDTYPLDRFVFDTRGSPWPIYRKTCTFTKT